MARVEAQAPGPLRAAVSPVGGPRARETAAAEGTGNAFLHRMPPRRRLRARIRPGTIMSVLAAVSVAVPGCGDRQVAPGEVFQPLADPGVPTLEVREVVAVGADDAEGGTTFERISSVAVGPDGDVWVLDGPSGRIVALDPEGREVRSFGGRGEGPGEFTLAGAMGFVGDTLWVLDTFSRRTTFFSLGGEVLGTTVDTVAVDPGRFRHPARPSAYLEGGWMVAAPAPRGLAADALGPVLRVDRTTGSRDTLVLRAAWTTTIPVPTGSFAFNPLTDHALVAVDPRGRWTVVAERPGESPTDQGRLVVRVRRREAADSLLFSVRYAADGEPVTPATRDSVVEAGVERLRANMEILSDLREAVDDPRAVIESVVRLPAYHSPVTAVVAASDGTTWIARSGVADGLRTWTVLGPGGAVRRHVRVPGEVRVEDVAGERVWGVATDPLDVQRLVGLDLVAAGDGTSGAAPDGDGGAGDGGGPDRE